MEASLNLGHKLNKS